MNNTMDKISFPFRQTLFLLVFGGFAYCGIEILFRGYSHISMFLLGGMCFWFMGNEDDIFGHRLPMITKMFLSALLITISELITGLFINVQLHMGVWDYSAIPLNFMGQICLLFCIFWFLLSYPGIYISEAVKEWFSNCG